VRAVGAFCLWDTHRTPFRDCKFLDIEERPSRRMKSATMAQRDLTGMVA
jgi:hypothetical protein